MSQVQDPSPEELEEIKRFIEEADEIDVVSDDIRQLVETHWPWLLPRLPPKTPTIRALAEADV